MKLSIGERQRMEIIGRSTGGKEWEGLCEGTTSGDQELANVNDRGSIDKISTVYSQNPTFASMWQKNLNIMS